MNSEIKLLLFIFGVFVQNELCKSSGIVTIRPVDFIHLPKIIIVKKDSLVNTSAAGYNPFFQICLSFTNALDCSGTEYITQSYNSLPVDFATDTFLPYFQIKTDKIDVIHLGFKAYDKKPSSLMDFSKNELLADMSTPISPLFFNEDMTITKDGFRLRYNIRITCDAGFFGLDCATTCTPKDSDAEGHFDCIVNEVAFISCLSGYGNPFTDPPCTTLIILCYPNPCMNDGSCSQPTPGQFSCDCSGTGFTGATCEDDIDECGSLNPCVNGGICAQGPPGTSSCGCVSGFDGNQCEVTLNPCLTTNCLNGGTCVQPSPGTSNCLCAEGFTGGLCETDIDECSPNPCINGGSCVQTSPSGFQCTCSAMSTGTTCQAAIDQCEITNPCQNGGTCTSSGSSVSCTCPPGYTGVNCNVDLDECINNPCRNNGVCSNVVGGFVCCCPGNLSGATCELETFEVNLAAVTFNGYFLRTALLFNCPGIEITGPLTIRLIGAAQIQCYQRISSQFIVGQG